MQSCIESSKRVPDTIVRAKAMGFYFFNNGDFEIVHDNGMKMVLVAESITDGSLTQSPSFEHAHQMLEQGKALIDLAAKEFQQIEEEAEIS